MDEVIAGVSVDDLVREGFIQIKDGTIYFNASVHFDKDVIFLKNIIVNGKVTSMGKHIIHRELVYQEVKISSKWGLVKAFLLGSFRRGCYECYED